MIGARPSRAGAAALMLALAGLGGGCERPADVSRADSETVARRIVTLSPHLTELVYSAGAGEYLVGVVQHSDFPEAARALPRVGDAFRIDLERMSSLGPDLVLAWESGNPPEMRAQLEQLGYRLVTVEPRTLADVAAHVELIGRLAGTSEVASIAASAYRERLAELERRAQGARKVSVFYQISGQPLYTINGEHTISQLIELCGGVNVFADLGQLAPTVSAEAVIARDPQVVITGSYDAAEMGARDLDLWRRWPDLRAVAGANLYTVPAEHVARPSARLLKGADELCAVLDEARGRLRN